MPSIYQLKPRFQALLRPVTHRLAQAGVSANQVTVAALLLSLMVGGVIAVNPQTSKLLLLVPGALFVRMALNAIDGMLAREHGMKSNLGAVLNELGDVLADVALYLPIALIPGVSPVGVVLVVIFGIISEMTGVIAVQIGASRGYAGPMGKSDRAFAFGLVALLLGVGIQPGFWLDGLWIVMLALLALTVVNRVRNALAEQTP
jgi:CDP-diacylglycerol--glycerol-3-phosphate 3-phosphatidyltransferase